MASTRRMTSRGRASPQKVLMTIFLVSWLINTASAAPTPVRTRPPVHPAGDLSDLQGQEPASRRSDPTAGDRRVLADTAEQIQYPEERAPPEFQGRVGPSAVPSSGQVQEFPVPENFSDSQDRRPKSAFYGSYPPLNDPYGADQVEYPGFPASPSYSTTGYFPVNNYPGYGEQTSHDDPLLQYIVPNQPTLPQQPPPAHLYTPEDTVRHPGYISGYGNENVHPKPLFKKYFRLNWNSSSIPLTKTFTVLEPMQLQQSLVDSNMFNREYIETIYVHNNLTDLRSARAMLKGDFDIGTCNPCHSQYGIKPYPSKNDWFERFLECGKKVYCPLLKAKIVKPCEQYPQNICNPCRRERKLVKTLAPGGQYNEIELSYKTIKTKYQTFFDHHNNRFEIVSLSDKNKEYEQCYGDTLPSGYDLTDLYIYY